MSLRRYRGGRARAGAWIKRGLARLCPPGQINSWQLARSNVGAGGLRQDEVEWLGGRVWRG